MGRAFSRLRYFGVSTSCIPRPSAVAAAALNSSTRKPRRRVAFTCLLPVHGGDKVEFFREAAISLGQSTLAPDEILICQDGPLPTPLEAAVRDWVRILGARVVQNPGPSGLQHNLNHALRSVGTPWIARCDSDDINLPRPRTLDMMDSTEFAVHAKKIRAHFFTQGTLDH